MMARDAGALVAGVVLERDVQPCAVRRDLAVLDRHVEANDLGNAQIANGPRGRRDGVFGGRLPGLFAGSDHFGHAVDTVRHIGTPSLDWPWIGEGTTRVSRRP